MHVFSNQTNEQFSKNLLANLSIPMSEEKLMQEDGQEFLNFNEQVRKVLAHQKQKFHFHFEKETQRKIVQSLTKDLTKNCINCIFYFLGWKGSFGRGR